MMNFTKIINIKWNLLLLLISIWMLFYIKVMSAMVTNINLQEEHMTYPEQQVILGSSVSLPCEVSALSSPSDSVTLILWYRGDDISGAPIYSVDSRARNTPLESAKHFINEEYEGRANFDISVRPAILKINPIIDSDDGLYWCRVDFRWTRTTISNIKLSVIVPPKRVIIKDDNGVEQKSVTVVDEGSDVRLFCEAVGGNPLSTITWYRNNRKLKTQTVMVQNNDTVVSGITFYRIERGDINSVIRCHAVNSDLTKPVIKSITIDINLRPLKAHIVAINRERLTAGRKVEAICHTIGSRPSAIVNWFISDRRLTQSKVIHLDGNGTKSIVNFIPTPEDNGLDLKCRAENPKLSKSATEDHINLDVKFMPNVSLSMGSATTNVTVNESNEILLECNVSSNPKPTRIRWLFNRKELKQDVTKGIIITNNTLVVKKARPDSEGRYQCVAYNSEGRGDSSELFVQVFFAPKCVSQQRIIETSLSYPTNVFCQVEAKPENVTFYWNSANIEDTRRLSVSSKSLRSKLTIIPQLFTDFGLYTCWAENIVGNNQLNPCIFNITDSGQSAPKPVTDCNTNVTDNSVYIKCNYFDLNSQLFMTDTTFHLQVRDSTNNQLILNQTNSFEPVFNVTNITSGSIYQLIVYVSNGFGVSNEVTMMVQTDLPSLKSSANAYPIGPNSQQQQTNDTNSSHKILVILISLLTGVLIILSILIMITIVLCFIRHKNNRKCGKSSAESGRQSLQFSNKKKYKNKKLSQTNAKTSDDSIATSDSMNRTPDVIPYDGVIFFNDQNIIDDNNDNGFIANNSLYRDIIINTGSDENNDMRIVKKNLLTNHVSVINDHQNGSNTSIDNSIFVSRDNNQCLGTFVMKYQTMDNTNDIEATTNFLQMSSSYPQTTPV